MTELTRGQMWQHRKRGGVYQIVSTGVKMQCSTYEEFETIVGEAKWVVYRSIEYPNACYMRLESEFLDGRFRILETLP